MKGGSSLLLMTSAQAMCLKKVCVLMGSGCSWLVLQTSWTFSFLLLAKATVNETYCRSDDGDTTAGVVKASSGLQVSISNSALLSSHWTSSRASRRAGTTSIRTQCCFLRPLGNVASSSFGFHVAWHHFSYGPCHQNKLLLLRP